MAYSASLIIESTSGGDKKQKSITDINPNATNEQLRVLAQGINRLTTNIYTGGTKVLKQNIAEEDSGKTVPTLSVVAMEYEEITVSTNSDGVILAKANDMYTCVDGTNILVKDSDGDPPSSEYQLTIYLTETANYAATSTTITVTEDIT